MQTGWFKFHRQALQNEVFIHDKTAWHVFCVLLMVADMNSGKWRGTQNQLGELVGIKPTTAYNACRRLIGHGMIKAFGKNKYTVFQICNWDHYQSVSKNKGQNRDRNENKT